MSYDDRLLILQLEHLWVGAGYIALSVSVGLLLAQLLALLAHLTAAADAKSPRERRRVDPTIGRLANRSNATNLAVGVMLVGTALFLFGCGVHHFHVAAESLPDAYDQGPRHRDVFVSDANFVHHALIQGFQGIGWPLLVFGAWKLRCLLRPS